MPLDLGPLREARPGWAFDGGKLKAQAGGWSGLKAPEGGMLYATSRAGAGKPKDSLTSALTPFNAL